LGGGVMVPSDALSERPKATKARTAKKRKGQADPVTTDPLTGYDLARGSTHCGAAGLLAIHRGGNGALAS
jgi:hypothetical protein